MVIYFSILEMELKLRGRQHIDIVYLLIKDGIVKFRDTENLCDERLQQILSEPISFVAVPFPTPPVVGLSVFHIF